MEPFVAEKKPGPGIAWMIVAGAAVVFFVWQLDLIPQILPANTGEPVADEATAGPEFAGWDAIIDHHGAAAGNNSPDATSPRNDPLISAIHDEPPALNDAIHTPGSTLPGDDASVDSDFFDLTEPTVGTTPDVVPAEAIGDSQGAVHRASFETHRDAAVETPPAETVPVVSMTPVPAELAEQLRRIDELGRQDLILEAHAELSRIYWKQPAQRSVIQPRLDFTSTRIFRSPVPVTESYFVEFGDTLQSIAAEYDVPWQFLSRLNGVPPEKLQAGQQLKVVRGPFGAVVELDTFVMTVHAHGWVVRQYQIGTGKDDRTPTGEFTVENKVTNPAWYNPDGGVVDADDPQNPLGEFWLGLGNHIGIHGTIDPESIGRAASRGCIHLADRDIEDVFELLDVGSPVVIRR